MTAAEAEFLAGCLTLCDSGYTLLSASRVANSGCQGGMRPTAAVQAGRRQTVDRRGGELQQLHRRRSRGKRKSFRCQLERAVTHLAAAGRQAPMSARVDRG